MTRFIETARMILALENFICLEKFMANTGANENVVVCLSGRGDKDVQSVAKFLGEAVD